ASTRADGCASRLETKLTAKPFGCTAIEQCDDGLDNNCNGVIDEDCFCTPGQVQSCFHGPPGRRGLGVCADGMQTCQGGAEFVSWGECMGGIQPKPETCNKADDDCNGLVDDGLCCADSVQCPSGDDPRVPMGKPFATYTLNGRDFFPGQVQSWRWRVEGGPCD